MLISTVLFFVPLFIPAVHTHFDWDIQIVIVKSDPRDPSVQILTIEVLLPELSSWINTQDESDGIVEASVIPQILLANNSVLVHSRVVNSSEVETRVAPKNRRSQS